MAVGRVVGRVGAGCWRGLRCTSEHVLERRRLGKLDTAAAPLATSACAVNHSILFRCALMGL